MSRSATYPDMTKSQATGPHFMRRATGALSVSSGVAVDYARRA